MSTNTKLPSLMNDVPVKGSGTSGADAGNSSGGPKGASAAKKQLLLVVLAVAMFAFAGWMLWSQLGGGRDAEAESLTRVMIDTKSGEVFPKYRLKIGDIQPFANPKTGERTLVPAEACFWTREGNAKSEPTYVLLNQYKGQSGDTICPDCGRKVTQHNPMPPDEMMSKARQGK